MINQKQKMKKSALIGSLLSAGLLFGAVACEKNGEFKVKDKVLLKKAGTLYNSLTTIANNEYKKVKGITDDVNYIKGLAAANCSLNDYMHVSEYYWSMYTDTDVITVIVNVTGDNEDDCVNYVNSNVNNENNPAVEVEVGEIYTSDAFEKFVFDSFTNKTKPVEKGSERYYIDANKPNKLLGSKVNDDDVEFSMTGITCANILFSTINWDYSISGNTNTGTGRGDEVVKDEKPITFTLITEYVKY
ncbi:MAG: hypothetical protein J6T15_02710 [Bacilli bacterium]|nr:hypothetical protein [Bacilli bacterium]